MHTTMVYRVVIFRKIWNRFQTAQQVLITTFWPPVEMIVWSSCGGCLQMCVHQSVANGVSKVINFLGC